MERNQVERAVNHFLETRISNEPEAVIELFAQGAHVRMAGSNEASSIAHHTQTTDELHASIRSLVTTWQWTGFEIHSVLVEGNSAAARYELNTVHVPTGTAFTSESMDQFYFDGDGKITEMVEFVDTARVAQLEADR